MKSNTFLLSALAAAATTFCTSSLQAQSVLDGVYNGDNYGSSTLDVPWYNGHAKDNSFYGDSKAGDPLSTTTIRYGNDGGFNWLFIEVPLYAKNMIWGDGKAPSDLTQLDMDPYGLDLGDMDFKKATGSEKLIFHDGSHYDTNDFAIFDIGLDDGKSDTKDVNGLLGWKDSVDYLIDNSLATEDYSNNRGVTMSFEFQFSNDAAGLDGMNTLVAKAQNGLDFHLSPEGILIPEPSSALLLGVSSFFMLMRRKRLK